MMFESSGLFATLEVYFWWAIGITVGLTVLVVAVRFWNPAARRLRRRGPLPRSLPFSRRRLVSNAELEALRLIRSVHPGLHVNVSTRLVDVVTPVRGLSRKERWEARSMVRAMHLDFLLCDQSMNPLLAIELDDSSHDSAAARRRDEIKNRAMAAAGIPLVRIHVRDLSRAAVQRLTQNAS